MRIAREEARRPFDLETGPVIRATLVEMADAEHALLITIHHIAADGWSMGVLVNELTAAYAARVAGGHAALAALTDSVRGLRRVAAPLDCRRRAARETRVLDAAARQLPGGARAADRPAAAWRCSRSRADSIRFAIDPETSARLAGARARDPTPRSS